MLAGRVEELVLDEEKPAMVRSMRWSFHFEVAFQRRRFFL